MIVQKLWGYCSILRDDGLSYPDYVEQLTYLLFLKMAHEQQQAYSDSKAVVPEGLDWPSLVSRTGKELHSHYSLILDELGRSDGMLGIIFHRAENKIRDAAKLRLLIVDLIDQRNWSALDSDVKGDAYEGLLEKNSQDTKSGAGQYFTPRPLVDAVLECVKPAPGETIYDPACGTAGFLIAAHRYITNHYPKLSPSEREHLRLHAFRGAELVDAVTRLGAMNLLLHGIGPSDNSGIPPIATMDSLSQAPVQRYDVVVTNPPFGKRSSMTVVMKRREGIEEKTLDIVRDDLWVSTSNKELNFLQHVANCLATKGRAAIVVPDGVLNAAGAGEVIRRRLFGEFNVHTLLRLPTGIFYAQGVNANVLFFERKIGKRESEKRLWVYDLRTEKRFSLMGNRLERSDLDEFVLCYSADNRSLREESWSTQNPSGRWRSFLQSEILVRDKANMDLLWLDDVAKEQERGPKALEEISDGILRDLEAAMHRISELTGKR